LPLNPRQQRQQNKEDELAPPEYSRGRPEPCDRCGYSKTAMHDESDLRVRSIPLYQSDSHIADGIYEIIIPGDGRLYLCGHHYHRHETHIAAKGYRVREWE
jgi:hypothetical protein